MLHDKIKRKSASFLVSIFVLTGIFTNQNSYAQEIAVNNNTSSSFTIIVLPDTQYYSAYKSEIFLAQTKWIKEHAQELNIKIVLHEGDITNKNLLSEWFVAQRSMRVLDGVVPYVMTVGNHDMGNGGRINSRDTSLFNRYFPFERYENLENFGGAFEDGKLDNAFYLFNASNVKWLVLTLEFKPRDDVLEWANSIAEEYSDRLIIVVTHSYLDERNRRTQNRIDRPKYGVVNDLRGANSGQDMWGKFISLHENIIMVFNGHHGGDGTGSLISRGENGNFVYQTLANYQKMRNGGNGFLRIVTVDVVTHEISVKTYSPYLAIYLNDLTNKFAYKNVQFLKDATECVYYGGENYYSIYDFIFFQCSGRFVL